MNFLAFRNCPKQILLRLDLFTEANLFTWVNFIKTIIPLSSFPKQNLLRQSFLLRNKSCSFYV